MAIFISLVTCQYGRKIKLFTTEQNLAIAKKNYAGSLADSIKHLS
jgi:hypothetical protein